MPETVSAALPLSDRQTTANVLRASGSVDPERAVTELRLEDGRVVRLSTAAMLLAEKGGAAPFAEMSRERTGTEPDEVIVPLAEEHLRVGKRVVETGTVRLHKAVQEYETTLDETLAIRTFDVERVVLNQVVETPPEVRHEGDTTIYPLLEEKLVVTRQLVLKEEVRVTKRDSERVDQRPVTLRRETLEVEREGRPGMGDGDRNVS